MHILHTEGQHINSQPSFPVVVKGGGVDGSIPRKDWRRWSALTQAVVHNLPTVEMGGLTWSTRAVTADQEPVPKPAEPSEIYATDYTEEVSLSRGQLLSSMEVLTTTLPIDETSSQNDVPTALEVGVAEDEEEDIVYSNEYCHISQANEDCMLGLECKEKTTIKDTVALMIYTLNDMVRTLTGVSIPNIPHRPTYCDPHENKTTWDPTNAGLDFIQSVFQDRFKTDIRNIQLTDFPLTHVIIEPRVKILPESNAAPDGLQDVITVHIQPEAWPAQADILISTFTLNPGTTVEQLNCYADTANSNAICYSTVEVDNLGRNVVLVVFEKRNGSIAPNAIVWEVEVSNGGGIAEHTTLSLTAELSYNDGRKFARLRSPFIGEAKKDNSPFKIFNPAIGAISELWPWKRSAKP